jgi:hypothetical protein
LRLITVVWGIGFVTESLLRVLVALDHAAGDGGPALAD